MQIRKLIANMTQALNVRVPFSGYGSDEKHPSAWKDYGYPTEITFDMLYAMYERNGWAAAGVELPADYTWQDFPAIYEGIDIEKAEQREKDTPWEAALADHFDQHMLHQRLQEADKRGRVGRYSAFVVQIKGTSGEHEWSKELGKITADNVVQYIPVYEGQLVPREYDTNESSENYGKVKTWQFNESALDPQDGQSKPRNVVVHDSRVIVFPEGANDGSINGKPCNKAGFNHLLNLEKIEGAGGEGFWKNAAQKLVFKDQSDDGGVPDFGTGDPKEDAKLWDQMLEGFQANMGKHLNVGGFDVTNLQSSLIDPKSFHELSLSGYSASIKMPSKILEGTQTGRLAGDSDSAQFGQNMQTRRENWGTTMICAVIDWQIKHGVIKPPAGSYSIVWSDITEPSTGDKLELVGKMADINQKSVFGGAGLIFTDMEMRLVANYKGQAEADPLPRDEREDDDEPEPEPEAEPTEGDE